MAVDSIRWFKSRAKALLKATKAGEASAVQRMAVVVPDGRKIGLQKAQHVVAVEAGFRCWKALLDAPEIEQLLAVWMDREPLLTNFGIGIWDGYHTEPRARRVEEFASEREHLRRKVGEVEWAVFWLRQKIHPIKSINLNYSSYGLKHLVEQATGRYLTNGVFIAAGMIAGYPYRLFPSDPNVCFGMSQRSINALTVA